MIDMDQRLTEGLFAATRIPGARLSMYKDASRNSAVFSLRVGELDGACVAVSQSRGVSGARDAINECFDAARHINECREGIRDLVDQ